MYDNNNPHHQHPFICSSNTMWSSAIIPILVRLLTSSQATPTSATDNDGDCIRIAYCAVQICPKVSWYYPPFARTFGAAVGHHGNNSNSSRAQMDFYMLCVVPDDNNAEKKWYYQRRRQTLVFAEGDHTGQRQIELDAVQWPEGEEEWQ